MERDTETNQHKNEQETGLHDIMSALLLPIKINVMPLVQLQLKVRALRHEMSRKLTTKRMKKRQK